MPASSSVSGNELSCVSLLGTMTECALESMPPHLSTFRVRLQSRPRNGGERSEHHNWRLLSIT